MALYSIENETCLGISHSGAVNVESEAYRWVQSLYGYLKYEMNLQLTNIHINEI